MARSYYDTLGVSRNASDKEVRNAYRRLARTHHPDLNAGSKEAQERFKEVNAAYEVLSDPDKRKKYDRFGENWKNADHYADRFTGGGFRTATDLGDVGFGGLFEDLRGRFRGGRRGRTTVVSTPVDVPVELTLEEVAEGVTRIVQTAAMFGSRSKRLEVKVPAGVDTGSRVHVPTADGSQINLVVTVRPHHRFKRKGADLHVELSIPMVDAVLGSQQEAPTLNGKVVLTIPPETQNGQVFRLRDKGMPRLGKPGRHGDLFATVKVMLPSNLSEQERQLFKDLKQARTSEPDSRNVER